MLELISFFQRAVPLTLLTGGGEDGGERGGPRAEEQTAKETERDGGRVSTVTEQVGGLIDEHRKQSPHNDQFVGHLQCTC